MNATGERLRELRRAAGLSQQQLSARASISQTQISKIELGKVEPRLTTLRKLADGLGVPLAVFDYLEENQRGGRKLAEDY